MTTKFFHSPPVCVDTSPNATIPVGAPVTAVPFGVPHSGPPPPAGSAPGGFWSLSGFFPINDDAIVPHSIIVPCLQPTAPAEPAGACPAIVVPQLVAAPCPPCTHDCSSAPASPAQGLFPLTLSDIRCSLCFRQRWKQVLIYEHPNYPRQGPHRHRLMLPLWYRSRGRRGSRPNVRGLRQ